MELVRTKEELDAKFENRDPTALRSEYVHCADRLTDLLDIQLAAGGYLYNTSYGSERRELLYLIRMEEAVSRLLSLEEKQISMAISRLEGVAKEFPSHAVAWLRLGEGYARMLDLIEWGPNARDAAERGERAYERAKVEVDNLTKLDGQARYFAGSPAQEAYIRDNLARLHAYLVWRSANRRLHGRPPNAELLRAAQRALELTFGAVNFVQSEGPRRRLLNSLAYFAAETVDFARRLDVPEKLPCSSDELKQIVGELEQLAPRRDPLTTIQVWDSIAYAYEMLGDTVAAERAARTVLIAHKEKLVGTPVAVSDYIREQEGRAIARAYEILGIAE